MNRFGPAMLFATLCLSGCVKKGSANVQFSAADAYNTTVQSTLINKLNRLATGASVNVCLMTFDGADVDPAWSEKSRRVTRANITSSLEKWMSVLAMHPQWPHKTPLPVVVNDCEPSKKTSESSDVHLTVAIYPSQDSWWKTACGERDCRSHASMLDARIDMETFDLEEAKLAHEIGHTLGLADVYQEEGRISFVLEQPLSIMSTAVQTEKQEAAITEDDRAGLFLLVDAMLSRTWDTENPVCPEGYTLDKDARGVNYGTFFCAPNDLKRASKALFKVSTVVPE